MRLLTISVLALGFALAAAQVNATPAVFLEYAGGDAQQGAGACAADPLCAEGASGDTLILDVLVSMEVGDTVTGVSGAVDLNPCGGCMFVSGTETPFHMINSVVLTPIIQGDIAVNTAQNESPNVVSGWEATTLSPAGAPGAATFSLGTLTVTLGDSGSYSLDVPPRFTSGGANPKQSGFNWLAADFEEIADQVTRGAFFIEVPEPTGALLTAASVGTVGLLARVRRRNS